MLLLMHDFIEQKSYLPYISTIFDKLVSNMLLLIIIPPLKYNKHNLLNNILLLLVSLQIIVLILFNNSLSVSFLISINDAHKDALLKSS